MGNQKKIYSGKKCRSRLPKGNLSLTGFTLLEVILTVSILSIALIVVIQSFSLILRSQKSLSNYTKAMFLIEKKLFDLQIDGIEKTKRTGDFKSPYDDFSWQLKITSTESSSLNKTFLSIFWQEQNNRKQIEIATYIRTP